MPKKNKPQYVYTVHTRHLGTFEVKSDETPEIFRDPSTGYRIQYIYTQEEHDRVKEEFERRVNADVDRCLKAYRAGTTEVLTRFVEEHLQHSDTFRPYGVSVSFDHLKKLVQDISAAHGIKESCDKKH